MAFQKVTDFIRFLQFCKCYHDKSKEAESFSKRKEGRKEVPIYNTASLTLLFILEHQSTEQHFISCKVKASYKATKPTLQFRHCTCMNVDSVHMHLKQRWRKVVNSGGAN